MKNLKKYIKKDNKVLWIISGIILLIILNTIFSRMHISKLEKELLTNHSNNIMFYMDNIENHKSKNLDVYILYALDYAYNEENKESLNAKEIKTIIKKIFNKETTIKEINNIGITPVLLDKNVIHSPEEKTYKIDRTNITQREIADTPIVVYKSKSMKKWGSKYVIKFKKITIKNPYDILNYYGDLNNKSEKTKNKNKTKKLKNYDTSKVLNYLTCKGKIKDIKIAVNDDIIKKYGKTSKNTIKVTYKLKGKNFYVDSIK